MSSYFLEVVVVRGGCYVPVAGQNTREDTIKTAVIYMIQGGGF